MKTSPRRIWCPSSHPNCVERSGAIGEITALLNICNFVQSPSLQHFNNTIPFHIPGGAHPTLPSVSWFLRATAKGKSLLFVLAKQRNEVGRNWFTLTVFFFLSQVVQRTIHSRRCRHCLLVAREQQP